MNIVVRKANKQDLKAYHDIIVERCKWFKDKNIIQWDDDYLLIFNEEYFNRCLNSDDIFVAVKDSEIIGGMLIRDKDIYYSRDGNTYYLHHFVTKLGNSKTGDILLNYALEYCKKNKKKYLRLDCINTNEKLNNYYLTKEFVCTGTMAKRNHFYNLYEREVIKSE